MMNLETNHNLQQVAIHEVGHAIVGVHHGLRLHMVDLYEERTFFKAPNNQPWEQVQELYLAGIAAEYLAGYNPEDSRLYKSGDWLTATKGYMNTRIDNHTIIERDKVFLAQHWEAVTKLADLLLKQGYVDHADVKAAMGIQ